VGALGPVALARATQVHRHNPAFLTETLDLTGKILAATPQTVHEQQRHPAIPDLFVAQPKFVACNL